MTILTWTPSSIVFTFPRVRQQVICFVYGLTMNASNAIYFQATGNQYQQSGSIKHRDWLLASAVQVSLVDLYCQAVGVLSTARYTSDGNHLHTSLCLATERSSRGVVSFQGGSPYYATAGVMIRETLSPSQAMRT